MQKTNFEGLEIRQNINYKDASYLNIIAMN